MAIVQFTVQFLIGGAALEDVLRFSTPPPAPGQNPFASFPVTSFVTFYLISLGLGAFQYLIVHNLVTGALANAISRSYHGQPTSILGAYSFGVRRYIAMILASLAPLGVGILLFGLIAACSFGAPASFASDPTGMSAAAGSASDAAFRAGWGRDTCGACQPIQKTTPIVMASIASLMSSD